jgi:N-ethylmaleimide reductase
VTHCEYNAQSENRITSEGNADAVAFSSAYIANHDLVEHIHQGVLWATPDINTYYTQGPKGYVDYPAFIGSFRF